MANVKNLRPGKNNRGGKRPGSGRPPDWLKEKCQSAVDKNALIDLITRIATGEETEQHITKDGDVVDVAPSAMVRLRAIEMLLDRGYGKPTQALEHSGSMSLTLENIIGGTVDQ